MTVAVLFQRLCLLTVASLTTVSSSASEYVFHHEYVLGTSLELRVGADSLQAAHTVEALVLAEVDRLNNILSRYDSSSELMRWQNGQLQNSVSKDLANVLERSAYWHQKTNGVFDVRVGALIELWQQAEQDQHVPTSQELKSITRQLQVPAWKQVDNYSFEQTGDLPITLDGLAKGYILDSVCDLVTQKFPGLTQLTINIGGDLRTIGGGPLTIGITDPVNSFENSEPIHVVTSNDAMGLATSGGYRRFFEINGRRYPQLLDPRTGQPVQHLLSATVIAKTAIDADAIATILCVLGRSAGLKFVESLDSVECLMIEDGRVVTSSGWPRPKTQFINFADKTTTEKTKPGLVVEFTLNRPKGGRYRRPYVAVWLEDADGFPVKTALLWMQTEQPGPRWHRDLTRWYRYDRLRKVVEEKDLIDTIAGATRGPGEYQARFDGTDNLGKSLPHGQYTLYIEVAREHGTYQLIRQPVELTAKPIDEQKLKDNVEVSQAAFYYIPWNQK